MSADGDLSNGDITNCPSTVLNPGIGKNDVILDIAIKLIKADI